MGWFTKLHWIADTEEEKLMAQHMPKFEPGELDRVEPEFQMRARRSNDPKFPECIIFLYLDGTLPEKTTAKYESQTWPTWRGQHPKRRSASGKYGVMKKNASVKATCDNVFCINQRHLIVKGIQPNQHSEYDDQP